MDKMINIHDFNAQNPPMSHTMTITDRKLIELTGVKTVDSFDNSDFLVDTSHGYLHIKGANLGILKMDTDNGILNIKGNIESANYLVRGKTSGQKDSFVKKIFK